MGERIWQLDRDGRLLITVVLEPHADHWNLRQYVGLAEFTGELVELTTAQHLSLTWAVGDPAHSAATPTLLAADSDQEIALLGDPNWLGPTAGRTRFARELARRIYQARHAAIPATSLFPRDARIDNHLDLLVKHGILAVAGVPSPRDSSTRVLTPRALHFGVWELPVASTLPRRSRWFRGRTGPVRRRIRRMAGQGAWFHLVIDAPAVVEMGTSAERGIKGLLRHVAALRQRGVIEVETLSQAARRLSHVPASTPQRSILRRAV